jgi:hypothetical protein
MLSFSPGYMLFELPSNIVLRKVATADWLSFIAFSWGTVMLGQGFVTGYQALAVCRTLLGIFEAGVSTQESLYSRCTELTRPISSSLDTVGIQWCELPKIC